MRQPADEARTAKVIAETGTGLMKHAATIAHLRQLCCLGLGGEAVMPALLRELHELTPCDSAAFFWVDAAGEMTNLYAERLLPPELMRLYFARFYDDGEHSFRAGFAKLANGNEPVAGTRFSDGFFRSDYYNLIWRQLDAYHALYGVIRENGRALGQLSLYRTHKDPPFSKAEHERLAAVTRYIAHALTAAPVRNWERPEREGNSTGLIILDRQHRLVHCSAEGRRLLFLATHPHISRGGLGANSADLPPALLKLCADLDRTFRNETAPPPVAHLQNAWGKFVCRAYRLSSDSEEGLVGVTVQHQTHLPLLLLAATKKLNLSPKQKEVILLLARRKSHSDVARQLNISINTVNYHVKQIYNKLDAHDQNEMLEKLLAGALG
jgi:DNA-binding CsgD family transcriptional regulator